MSLVPHPERDVGCEERRPAEEHPPILLAEAVRDHDFEPSKALLEPRVKLRKTLLEVRFELGEPLLELGVETRDVQLVHLF